MINANDNFKELEKAIKEYITMNYVVPSDFDQMASWLVYVFKESLPRLARDFPIDVPDHIYARTIISLGVAGINEEVTEMLWEKHFRGRATLRSIAFNTSYALRTVQRKKSSFYRDVAHQLFEKDVALRFPEKLPVEPQTERQRWENTLREKFQLTNKQLEITLEFCKSGRIGRKEIADKLYITENTMKIHIRNIIRKIGADSMNNAVKKALDVLREAEEAQGDK